MKPFSESDRHPSQCEKCGDWGPRRPVYVGPTVVFAGAHTTECLSYPCDTCGHTFYTYCKDAATEETSGNVAPTVAT